MQKLKYLGLIITFCLLTTACSSLIQESYSEADSLLIVPPAQEEAALQVSIPVDAVEPEEIKSEPPMPLSPDNWPAHFVVLLEELENSHIGIHNLVRSLHLMDITLDGVPELLIIVSTEAGWGPTLMALSWDFPVEEIESLMPQDAVFSGLPLGFFRNDATGEIIFSSIIVDHFFSGIAYHFSDGLLPYRVVGCRFGVHTLHDSTGIGRGDLLSSRLIEEIDTGYEYDIYGVPICGCGIKYGHNSSDSTVVNLVSRALEGFTEIPAPPMYSFNDIIVWDEEAQAMTTLAHRMDEIQQWIFEVAESCGV